MSNSKGKTGIASIVLGVISLGLLFAFGYYTLILLAFATNWAWLPLMPSVLFSLIGLLCGLYTKRRLGIVLNLIVLFILLVFLAFVYIF